MSPEKDGHETVCYETMISKQTFRTTIAFAACGNFICHSAVVTYLPKRQRRYKRQVVWRLFWRRGDLFGVPFVPAGNVSCIHKWAPTLPCTLLKQTDKQLQY